ncbi:hypothetical protein BD626DRAFT_578658 [Schizophyllum amplum]|uniref:Uncharacterized protein n=1 Tax=Schizophyllum amplum TaxID=97359 RepID=A0A550BRW2_9AGAR|nr:hypothetical protein BD626DRAFT_578658 [Auriculariopsis ampla]
MPSSPRVASRHSSPLALRAGTDISVPQLRPPSRSSAGSFLPSRGGSPVVASTTSALTWQFGTASAPFVAGAGPAQVNGTVNSSAVEAQLIAELRAEVLVLRASLSQADRNTDILRSQVTARDHDLLIFDMATETQATRILSLEEEARERAAELESTRQQAATAVREVETLTASITEIGAQRQELERRVEVLLQQHQQALDDVDELRVNLEGVRRDLYWVRQLRVHNEADLESARRALDDSRRRSGDEIQRLREQLGELVTEHGRRVPGPVYERATRQLANRSNSPRLGRGGLVVHGGRRIRLEGMVRREGSHVGVAGPEVAEGLNGAVEDTSLDKDGDEEVVDSVMNEGD